MQGFEPTSHLESSMKLFLASLEQLEVARRVDGVAEVGVLPLRQVVLLRSPGHHLLSHQRRTLQLRHLLTIAKA